MRKVLAILFGILLVSPFAMADSLPNPEFSLTTTSMTAGTTFNFKMSAKGSFTVDWGDGTVENINRDNTELTTYSHTYTSSGVYTIGMSGDATGYSTGNTFDNIIPAISFSDSGDKIASISGSLGTIFPSTGANNGNTDANGSQPRFYETFANCVNLTSIPENLFQGVIGRANYMFAFTFDGCTNLVSIPENLFSYINNPNSYTFRYTFRNCSSLTSIPENLFRKVTTIKGGLFAGTFYNCSSLTSIPENLFSTIQEQATCNNYDQAFYYTFAECSSLTSIPEKLFQHINCPATSLFVGTFAGAESLTAIPGGLFENIHGNARSMFYSTFERCSSITSIPENLFSGITGSAVNLFTNTFNECSSLTTIPENLFSGITGSAYQMFSGTFFRCRALTSIPENLFSGVSGADGRLFEATFTGCTSLTNIPENLFAGVSGNAPYLFTRTFESCSGLQTIPEGLFSGVTGSAESMFSTTFYKCTSLTSIPENLFSGVNGSADEMFLKTFYYSSNITSIGSKTYIPTTFLSNVNEDNGDSFVDTFTGTKLATTCPVATRQVRTEYMTDFGGKVSCTDAFTITTTSMTAGTVFRFKMSAKGTFTVDWGDGTIETIDRTDTTLAIYSHTYETAGKYIIRMSGVATEYNASSSAANADAIPTISFYFSQDEPTKISEVNGSIGWLFPTLGTTQRQQPIFYLTFGNAPITKIPENLFDGVFGAGIHMFSSTFKWCRITSIPEELFSGVSGAAGRMFDSTFANTKMTTIPEGLFSGVSGAARSMFTATFQSSRLSAIPENLFQNVRGSAVAMFLETFQNAPITSIPENLFRGVNTTNTGLFFETFAGCTKLTSIPSGLFSNLTGTAKLELFRGTFKGDTKLTAIPSGLFQSVSGGAEALFRETFKNCSNITEIPETLFDNVTNSYSYLFRETFSGCKAITKIPENLFPNISGASSYMFQSTFSSTGITAIPAGLFAHVSGNASSLFASTFNSCSSLLTIPEGLFSGVSGSADNMFASTFKSCSKLANIKPATGSSVTFIPHTMFANVNENNGDSFVDTFTGTKLATTCPSGYGNDGRDYWSPQVSCVACGAGDYKTNDVCTPCPLGYRCYQGSRSKCTYGMYSGETGQTHCTACPVGTTTNIIGATSVDDCVACANSANVKSWRTDLYANQSTTSNVQNSCRISKCNAGYHLVETIGDNLFDITKVGTGGGITNNGDSITATGFPASGVSPNLLQSYCSDCQVDKDYLISFESKTSYPYIFLIKGNAERQIWNKNTTLRLTSSALSSDFRLYSGTYSNISIREYSSSCEVCPENTYESNGECISCPTGLFSYAGSDESGDCSHILHVGDATVHMRSNRETTPSLNVKIGDQIFYGNMTLENATMSGSTDKHLRINYNNEIWSVYDETSVFESN